MAACWMRPNQRLKMFCVGITFVANVRMTTAIAIVDPAARLTIVSLANRFGGYGQTQNNAIGISENTIPPDDAVNRAVTRLYLLGVPTGSTAKGPDRQINPVLMIA